MDSKKQYPLFHPKRYPWFEIVCLIIMAGAVYFATLDHTFHFDDKQNIWNNSFIQISSLSFSDLMQAGFEGNLNKRPVANISFALNYYFHGLDVRGFHGVNIFIHLLASIMLFYFVRITLRLPILRDRYGDAWLVPFFTALIWLVHPLNTQSVTYIVQRMNSMAAMFFIMAMLFYVKARITPSKMKRITFFCLCFIGSFLAFGTKENTATLPLFIILYEWYFFQDLRVKITRTQLFWLVGICLVFVFILYHFLGSSPLNKLTHGYGGRTFTLDQRLLTEPRVVLHYISLLFLPYPGRLNLDYDFPLSYSLVDPLYTTVSIAVIIGMAGLAVYTARKNRLYSFCILWFLGNLVIESSIIALEIVFEHRTYLPSMLAILLFVVFFHERVKKKTLFIDFLVIMSLLFSYWTYERNKVWQNELTLWADTHNKSPDKARVNQHYGVALSNAGRIDEALPIFEKALYLYEQETKLLQDEAPRLSAFHLQNLGVVYKKKGEYKKAIHYLNRALKQFYFSSKTHFHLGFSYEKIWRLNEAIFHYSKALEYASHHSTDLAMQENLDTIRRSLEKAQKLQKAKEQREKLKNNDGS
jgi:tetratricopeptide (TPR) repeat protein